MNNTTKHTHEAETNEMTQIWKDRREEQKQRRLERLPRRVQFAKKLEEFGFTVQELTEYQFRISRPDKPDRKIDVYPIHLRFHDINKSNRGQIRGEKRLIPFIVSRFNIPKDEKDKIKKWIHDNFDNQLEAKFEK